MTRVLIIYAVVIFAAGGVVGWSAKSPFAKIVTDTVIVERKFVDTVVEPKYFVEIDTIRERANVDSIWRAAREYWRAKGDTIGAVDYVASYDTSDDGFSLDVEYRQRIPLDPEGSFDVRFNFRDEVVVKRETSWLDSFGFGVVAGVGYDPIAERPSFIIGVGGYYEL